MAGDEKNVQTAPVDTGIDPLEPLTKAVKQGVDSITDWLAAVNSEIVRLQGGVATAANLAASRHEKLRVRGIVFSRATAGVTNLTVGTVVYPFTLAAQPVFVPFPLLIERATDLSIDGDGNAYLICDVE